MSGTWTRRRRGTGARDTERRTPTTTGTAISASPPSQSTLQPLVARSLERVFEDAELEGVLDLSSRKLKQFPVAAALKYDLSDVVSLDVCGNRLLELPAGLFSLHCLETLRVRGNSLRRLPSAFSLLHALTYLDVSNNLLSDLPPSLSDLRLEVLLVGGNRLQSVPRHLRGLSSTLTELDLSFNQLTSLHPDLALLKSLRVLNISNNELEEFPPELCRLPLRILDISRNVMKVLPLEMHKMSHLTSLSLLPNPLLSPPLKIAEKGRLHTFRWLEKSSSSLPPRPISTSTTTLPQPIFAHLRSVPARRTATSRLPTQTGSDSGYDEKILSSSEHHNSLEELCGPAEVSSLRPPSPLLASPAVDHSQLTAEPSLIPTPEVAISHSVPSTAVSNNEVASAVEDPPKVSEKSEKKEKERAGRNKPISKVAPMPSRQPPTRVGSLQSSSRPSTGRLSAPPSVRGGVSAVPGRTLLVAQPARPRPQVPSAAVKTKPPLTASGMKMISSTTSLSALPKSPVAARRGPVSATKNGNGPVRVSPAKPVGGSTLTNRTTDSAAIEAMMKMFSERLGIVIENEKGGQSVATRLSDGVLLCRLMNALHPAACRTICVPQDGATSLPLLKSKRNAQAFIDACRSIRVNLLCSADDIVHRRNMAGVARSVAELGKLAAESLPVSHV